MIKTIKRNLINSPGWHTKRKIIVIESDDWGSIRMRNQKTFDGLLKAGIRIDKLKYDSLDGLETRQDLELLFDLLDKYKDKNGNPAKFTTNMVLGNPDFEKIEADDFQHYHRRSFLDSYEYYNQENLKSLWFEGIDKKLIQPQFHAREHLNVSLWMTDLQNRNRETHQAFQLKTFGISGHVVKEKRGSYQAAFDNEFWAFNRKKGIGFQAAFDLEFAKDLKEQEKIIRDGLMLFKKIHNKKAAFFVPPNGPINNKLEKITAEEGIKFMSTPKIQTEVFGDGKTKNHFRYIGKKNKHNQVYITRNAFFEPSGASNNQVDSCLREIELAFRFKKPAVISSHRVNYIGSLVEQNRTSSLSELKELLKQITKKWPDVEFMTSSELGGLIIKKHV